MAGSDVPIAMISGPAGIGKTALAVHWAHRVRHRYPDGMLVLDLMGHDPDAALRPDEALAYVLGGLGVPPDRVPATVAGQLGLYRSLAHGRRMLLLLDNAGTADHVLPLVPPGAGTLLVVTSRHRLAALPAQRDVRRIELDVLDRRDALALLGGVLGDERVNREPAGAAELVEACGRIPLALRIAAARLVARPRLSIVELVGELAANRLDALSLDGDSYSVRAVFAGAYDVLSDPAARLFRLLGLNPGATFTGHLAAAATGISYGRARRGVDELAGAHLVTELDGGRFRFHDLIRLYAAERARLDEEPDEVTAATDRIIDWYVTVAAAANRILDPGRDRVVRVPPTELPFAADPESALAFLDEEHTNVMAVVAYAERHGHPTAAWQLAYLIAGYFESRGHAVDRIAVYRHGLAAAQRSGDPVVEGLMLSGLGVACIAARRTDEALGHLRAALALMRAAGDRRGEGHACNNIAVALIGLRRFDEAIAVCTEALAVHTASGHTHGVILALNNLGFGYGQSGRTAPGLVHLRRGLDLARRDGDVRLEAVILNSMGETHQRAGADAEALGCFEQALDLRRRTGNRHYEARTLNEIGTTHVRMDAPAAARTAFGEAYRVARQIGDEHLEAVALANLGRVLLATGDLVAARDHLTAALALRGRVPDEHEEAGIFRALDELDRRRIRV